MVMHCFIVVAHLSCFQLDGVQYRQVCGRAIGYRWGENLAFYGYYGGTNIAIDVAYVDGLSVTHGQSPRTHIWTFASGLFLIILTVPLAGAVLVMRGTPMVLLHLWEMTTFVIVWPHLITGIYITVVSFPTMRCGMVS